ncbi:MAG TPA: TonB-dependent receptor [Bryobacteraceae bacterium]|nr:TonB-dependent receptor [Bryobacteraceae bacterium]HPT25065.1 TonB-dependent receptor [Bryobacteraceae bacterium]
MNSLTRTLLFTFLVVCLIVPAAAQSMAGLGAINGVVRDASGAVVPAAKVVVSNASNGLRRNLETNESGLFSAPSLTPGEGYEVSVLKEGFAAYSAKQIAIQVGQNVTLNIGLDVKAQTQEVTVTTAAPIVDESKTGVSQVVGSREILNLPINGRRVDSFVLLTPAVTEDGTFGLVSFRGIAGGNSFLTDGNDTTNSFYNENAGRTRISTQISQDAVQEFQVLSNGFSAEFGRAMGGVVNTVTRSGGNDTHGTAYWFFRNRSLNATDRYAGGVNAPEWRHQAGASLGGAIAKDKLFYFMNFEVVKRNFPALNRIINNAFTDTAGNAILPTACTATADQCAKAISFISRQMNVLVPRKVSSVMGLPKFDWRPSEKNSFSVSFNAMHWRSPYGIQTQAVLTGGAAIGDNGNSTVETRYGKASWTSIITNNVVSELRYGLFKDRLSDPASSDQWPAETGGLYISVAGATVGASRGYPRTYPSELRHQLAENLSWIHGAHSLRFGIDFSTTTDWMDQLYNGKGAYSYSSLTNFAKDFSGNSTNLKSYSSFTQAFGNPIHSLRTTDINAYIQDAHRVSRRLTLNYGLRYEKAFLPQPTMTNSAWPQTGRVPGTDMNFAPRFSAAYSLNDKTVLRAGYGIFYARMHGNMLDTLFLGNGLYQTSISMTASSSGSPTFPNVFTSASGLPSGSVSLGFAAPDLRNPYTQQGTISIDRELRRDLGLTVSYIWSRGIGLFTQRDLNLGPLTNEVYTYTIKDLSGNIAGYYPTRIHLTANRVDKNYSKILQVENGGQSWYNGLAVQLQKRMSHGLQAQVSYTWSHAIDTADMQGASWNIGSNYNNATYNGDYSFDKGSSGLDQRHRAVINWLWTPKFTQSDTAFARYFVNGWELSTITTMASSKPATPTVSVSGSTQFTGKSMPNSSLNGSGGWNRVPFLPVGYLDIDQIFRVDGRLVRSIPVNERVKTSLMFEAFNMFNTMYNTSVSTSMYSVSGGVMTPYSTVGRGTASQGFPDGTNARRMQVALRVTF